jgi:antirestriction protein ArdC
MEKPTQHFDVYALITNLIIQKLEEGIVPWKQPWTKAGLPQNLMTRRPYTGINVWLLASMGFSQNYFLSFKQVQELGGSVMKGSKSIPVVFWKQEEKEDPETKEIKKTAILRYYSVFNIAQCEGLPEVRIPAPEANKDHSPIKSCDAIVLGMPDCPKISHRGSEAFYDSVLDFINMPVKKSFKDALSYYETLFHELVHSTGHSKRLGRKEITEPNSFASEPYSKEELVAEIGACYLKSYAGIDTVTDNNVAYIDYWLKQLRDNKRLIIFASAKAQRAADYILNQLSSENKE